jgi:hypothetical protein
VNHHGSKSSTNRTYFNKAAPALGVIGVGDDESTRMGSSADRRRRPRAPRRLNLMRDRTGRVRPANRGGQSRLDVMSTTGYCVGNIKMTTDGTSTFMADADGLVHQGVNEKTAAGLPLTLNNDDAIRFSARRITVRSAHVPRERAPLFERAEGARDSEKIASAYG